MLIFHEIYVVCSISIKYLNETINTIIVVLWFKFLDNYDVYMTPYIISVSVKFPMFHFTFSDTMTLDEVLLIRRFIKLEKINHASDGWVRIPVWSRNFSGWNISRLPWA